MADVEKKKCHETSPRVSCDPIQLWKGGADRSPVSSLAPLQSCGVDFEIKAFATHSTDVEEDKIPKK